MRSLLVLSLLMLLSGNLGAQTCPIADIHLDIGIISASDSVPCKFELVYVAFKKGQPTHVERRTITAPYKLTIQGHLAYFVVQGLSGNGQVISHYKTMHGQKRSSDYLGQNEIVSFIFTPIGVGVPGVSWVSSKPKGSLAPMNEITMIRLMNE